MSSHKEDGSPDSSSPPGHYRYSNYATPSHHQNFFPQLPPLPPLPGLAHPIAGMHGVVPYYNNGAAEASSIIKQPSASRSDDNIDSTLSGKSLFASYATPSSAKETPRAQLVIQTPSGIRKTSPYFSPEVVPAPAQSLKPVSALAISPNDTPGQDSTSVTVYKNSPYFSEAPNLAGSGSSESASSSSTSESKRPVPARSAFMCFSEAKGKEIVDRSGDDGSKGGFVEGVAAEWRSLSKQDRAHWENVSKQDKTRYANEKKAYKGPLARKLRAKKNPLAPKRPMSAFLMFAQQKRRPLQRENPNMPNADISRLLGELWRNGTLEEKRPFLEREETERKLYKAKMEAWKNDEKLSKSMKSSRGTARASVARNTGKKADQQRQDVASFTQEESHSNQRLDPVQNSMSARNESELAHYYQSSYANNGVGTPTYHAYGYPASWYLGATPSHDQQDLGGNVKYYTYPRPPQYHHK